MIHVIIKVGGDIVATVDVHSVPATWDMVEGPGDALLRVIARRWGPLLQSCTLLCEVLPTAKESP